jgi:prepilin-type N-terminal cleavage/methylation domain-containing protein
MTRHRHYFVISSGFTLTEIIIVLGILSFVATVSITKTLISVEQSKIKATAKEALSTMSSLTFQGMQSGIVRQMSDIVAYIESNLNAAKVCNPLSSCRTASAAYTYYDSQPGFVLNNGAHIAVFVWGSTGGKPMAAYLIDANGSIGPNIEGEDTFTGFANFNSSTVSEGGGCPYTARPGALVSSCNDVYGSNFRNLFE